MRPGGSQLTARAAFFGNWPPGAKIIDIGCGCGDTLAYLRRCGFHAIGVDLSEQTLRQATILNDGPTVVQASGDELPFADASADGVLAECSLSLMPNPAKALSEFHRILRPCGRLVITDLYERASNPPNRLSDVQRHPLPKILEKEGTIRQLEHAGFGVDRWEDHSDVLKAFVIRFIFEHGSLDALWGETSGACLHNMKSHCPGYALLVARKGNS
jgi:ubiquinone/menaquinone biosynthesis C-methylase UbiE